MLQQLSGTSLHAIKGARCQVLRIVPTLGNWSEAVFPLLSQDSLSEPQNPSSSLLLPPLLPPFLRPHGVSVPLLGAAGDRALTGLIGDSSGLTGTDQD